MIEALAVSSDVYFYTIGGGFEDQRGMGIANIEKYTKLLVLEGLELIYQMRKWNYPKSEWKLKILEVIHGVLEILIILPSDNMDSRLPDRNGTAII